MIRIISWRNIWRNHGRSLVVIFSIAIGIWVLIFTYGFMNSFMDGYVKNQVKYETSHIQIHNPTFKTDYEIKYTIENGRTILEELRNSGDFKAISHHSLCNGMITSPRKASGIRIKGVVPEEQLKLLNLDSFLIEGAYFEGVKRNPIIIGYKTAEKLKIKLKSKVVLTFQDVNGQIVAGAFRVCGIVKTPSLTYNEMTAIVKMDDLNRLLGIGEEFHEIAMLARGNVDELAKEKALENKYENLLVESWMELAPELEYFQKSSGYMLGILQVIIMIALVFGIINTMLMSVLERFRELGMIMAIGMNKRRVFSMIMLETLFLALVGSPLGLLLSIFTMYLMGEYGIDLSNYSEGLEMYGYDHILYPFVQTESYVRVIIGVFVTAIIGAVYPAWKAIKLKPAEALHKI